MVKFPPSFIKLPEDMFHKNKRICQERRRYKNPETQDKREGNPPGDGEGSSQDDRQVAVLTVTGSVWSRSEDSGRYFFRKRKFIKWLMWLSILRINLHNCRRVLS